MLVLVVDLNPSLKNPDPCEALRGTRSGALVDRWLSEVKRRLDMDFEIAYTNLSNNPTRSQATCVVTDADLSDFANRYIRLSAASNRSMLTVALGKRVARYMKKMKIKDWVEVPHPSGLNRVLNDPAVHDRVIEDLCWSVWVLS